MEIIKIKKAFLKSPVQNLWSQEVPDVAGKRTLASWLLIARLVRWLGAEVIYLSLLNLRWTVLSLSLPRLYLYREITEAKKRPKMGNLLFPELLEGKLLEVMEKGMLHQGNSSLLL